MKLTVNILSGVLGFLAIFVHTHHPRDLFPNLEIVFYVGPNYYPEYFNISNFESVTTHPSFVGNLTTMIYIHGYTEGLLTKSVQTVISAYQKRNDTNVFVLNWQNYSSGIYITDAIPHAIGIGNLIGFYIFTWVEQGILNNERLHIVAHSLGAQLAGYIGKSFTIFTRGTKRIKRITGLDPAKPLWYLNLTSSLTYISKEDAELVDIIHTNAGILGAAISVGNCDFYPNGGFQQPGCFGQTDPLCDHARSWYYYAESVQNQEPTFEAIRCESYAEFKKLNCTDSSSITYMGYHAPMDCSGEYFLQTNTRTPFSRGIFGLQYYPSIDTDRQVGNEEN